ncbi:YwqG family protein [Dactylosporangium sp. NPDC005572]|uniref:YwqG family protein n=1 Tax=Dactylosporangium sp. NPDC005572 TaxID=3156889 RepID=UPI0033A8EC4B
MELDAAGLAKLYATLDADVAATVAGFELPSVRLQATHECEPDAAVTRFGGVPLVGADFAWPHTEDGQPLCLVGQWLCDEVNQWIGETVLPDGTLLCFFFDVDEQAGWGLTPHDAPLWRVTTTDAATATSAQPPDRAVTFPARSTAGRRVLTMPDVWEPVITAVWAEHSAEAWAYQRLRLDDAPGPVHRIFGWPEPQQSPMHLDCQLVSNGVDLMAPGGYSDPRVPGLQADAAGWQLLWQVDTDERGLGWMWGDMGMLYFWIRSEDLAVGRFDRVSVILQG